MIEIIVNAKSYVDLFGSNVSKQKIHKTYKNLVKVCHPDIYGDDKIYSDTFKKLTEFYNKALDDLDHNNYGELIALIITETKLYRHEIIKQIKLGDISSIFFTRSYLTSSTIQTNTISKIPTSYKDNDLIENEEAALKILNKIKDNMYFPKLIDSYKFKDTLKHKIKANVLNDLSTTCYDLYELRNKVESKVFNTIHLIWIWRKLLYGLGLAHDEGIIHGAIVPENIMVEPNAHGIIISDWCYSSIKNKYGAFKPIKLIIQKYKNWYPNEIFEKNEPTKSLDIYMAAKCMIWAAGGNPETNEIPEYIDKRIRTFIKSCIQHQPKARPQNTWLLLNDFDDLLKNIGEPYYPRRFIELKYKI